MSKLMAVFMDVIHFIFLNSIFFIKTKYITNIAIYIMACSKILVKSKTFLILSTSKFWSFHNLYHVNIHQLFVYCFNFYRRFIFFSLYMKKFFPFSASSPIFFALTNLFFGKKGLFLKDFSK